MDKKTEKNLRNLAKFIEKIPRKHFDMDSFATTKEWSNYKYGGRVCKTDAETVCGTTCCIAGWEIVRKGYCIDMNQDVTDKKGNILSENCEEFARDLIGLSQEEAEKLFYDCNWPHKTPEEYVRKPVFKSTPKGAAKRILHLIEKGE